MISGRSPLELAFGRKPRDIIDVENANPEQLSVEPPLSEVRDQMLQRLAMNAHNEARQLLDLRRDLARRLRPTDGPFQVGDKIFYWVQDPNKIKPGEWVRGKVISQQGAIVGIDTGTTIMRVNQSLLRKDPDVWHDVAVPFEDDIEEVLEHLEPVFWQVQRHGRLDFLELFSGSAHAACAQHGLAVGPPIDLRTGFDLNSKEGQQKAWKIITDQQPAVIFMALVCTWWSPLSNAIPAWSRNKRRKQNMPMVRFCIQVAYHQMKHKRFFFIENPQASQIWSIAEMTTLRADGSVTRNTLNMCAYGMKDPESKKLYEKPVSLVHMYQRHASGCCFAGVRTSARA
jgi:hypothetical protein